MQLSEFLEGFIKKYVQCYSCGNPETAIKVKKVRGALWMMPFSGDQCTEGGTTGVGTCLSSSYASFKGA